MFEKAISLPKVVYDKRARDGTWCLHPYYDHPKGCPNFLKRGKCCTASRTDFRLIEKDYDWFAVVEEFDLKAHAAKMKEKFPNWTDRQCRNPLYWQQSVRKKLRGKANAVWGNILLDIPEANGVEVFETMKNVGVGIDRHPDIVRKVMLVGKKKKR